MLRTKRHCHRRRRARTNKRPPRHGGKTYTKEKGGRDEHRKGYFSNWKLPSFPRFSNSLPPKDEYQPLLDANEEDESTYKKQDRKRKERTSSSSSHRRWPTWRAPIDCTDSETAKNFHWRCLDNYKARCDLPPDLRNEITKINEKCLRTRFYKTFHPKCNQIEAIQEHILQCDEGDQPRFDL